MKRAIVLAALATLVAAGTADAAAVRGVVLAKDAKRKALVVASRGSVSTVRAPQAFRRARVGDRVAAGASRRADGTYVARSLRRLGRAGSVRFRAVVVANQAGARRLIVSAGGSVFAVRTVRSARSAQGDGLGAGDRVDVEAEIEEGALEAGAGDVKEVGRVGLMELEGIFLFHARRGGGFYVAVLQRGLVHVRVRQGTILPDFEPGDQVFLVVGVSSDGVFTFVKGREDSHDGSEKPGGARGELEAYGALVARSEYAVEVRKEDGRVVGCAVPAGLDLSIFRIGERVKLYCRALEGRFVLVKIRTETAWIRADGTGELTVYGFLAAKSSTSVGVRREEGVVTSCSLRAAYDLSRFNVGDKVKLSCKLVEDRFVLAELRSEHAALSADGVVELFVWGALEERAGTTVSVRRADGSSFGCSAPAELDLSLFATGEKVQLTCRQDAGGYALVSVRSERAVVEVGGGAELTVYGTLAEKGETSLVVQREDSSTLACDVPAGTDLSAFPVGARVMARCVKVEGRFRLYELKSEHGYVKIPR